MTNLLKKVVSCILCLTLVLGLTAAPALAEWTTLQVVFFGLSYGE